MSDNVEWRKIPGFPKYEITIEGDVRNRDSRVVLKEIENKNTGAYSYCLHIGWGNNTTHRNFWGLVYAAYPELLADWRDIPGFPKYMTNRAGEVMGKRLWNMLPPTAAGTYVLRAGGGRKNWHKSQINAEVWDNLWSEEEQEAA